MINKKIVPLFLLCALGATHANAQQVDISGLIETEAAAGQDYDENYHSDIALATVEIALSSKLNDDTSVDVLILHEDDGTEPAEIDSATMSFSNLPMGTSISIGRQYLPFGVFETSMISDPLTLELAETRQAAFHLGSELGALTVGISLFQGDVKDYDKSPGHPDFALNIGYDMNFGGGSMSISGYYLQDLIHTDSLTGLQENNGVFTDSAAEVAGAGGAIQLTFGDTQLIAECAMALDDFAATNVSFNGNKAKPSACHYEAAMSMSDMTVALGFQTSDEMLDSHGVPSQRILLALSKEISKNSAIAIEWANDSDYDTSDGGTGESANTITGQVAVSF